MPDPLTIAAVGGVALTEGIRFLYGQAAEALKTWREHRAKAAEGEASPVPIPVEQALPPVFAGELAPLAIHLPAVERLADHMLRLRAQLANHVDGVEPMDPGDPRLLETVDALRQVMEAVYEQRLTFRGEQRAPSGPVVRGAIDVESVAGVAAAVEARIIGAGTVDGSARATRVEETGRLYGVRADRIGD